MMRTSIVLSVPVAMLGCANQASAWTVGMEGAELVIRADAGLSALYNVNVGSAEVEVFSNRLPFVAADVGPGCAAKPASNAVRCDRAPEMGLRFVGQDGADGLDAYVRPAGAAPLASLIADTGAGNDRIGTSAIKTLADLGAGDDSLQNTASSASIATVIAGPGADNFRLYGRTVQGDGGEGDDVIDGRVGAGGAPSRLDGGAGDDTLVSFAPAGVDVALSGGIGDDRLSSYDTAATTISCGPGADLLTAAAVDRAGDGCPPRLAVLNRLGARVSTCPATLSASCPSRFTHPTEIGRYARNPKVLTLTLGSLRRRASLRVTVQTAPQPRSSERVVKVVPTRTVAVGPGPVRLRQRLSAQAIEKLRGRGSVRVAVIYTLTDPTTGDRTESGRAESPTSDARGFGTLVRSTTP